MTLMGFPPEGSTLPFISSCAKAASDDLENLMYTTPEKKYYFIATCTMRLMLNVRKNCLIIHSKCFM